MRPRILLALIAALLCLESCGGEPPRFLWVRGPSDTCDTVGPYRVEAQVFAANGVYSLTGVMVAGSGSSSPLAFTAVDEQATGGVWALELPGRPAGSRVSYYIKLIDGLRTGGGSVVYYPEGAPEVTVGFAVLPAEACQGI